jgi:prolyl-tRNA synthetase
VVVPIYKNEDERVKVMEAVESLRLELHAFRIHVDDRSELTPGFKFNDWELRGVPLRIEIGPKDVEKGTVALARRDIPGKAGKSFVPNTNLADQVGQMLATIQAALYAKALAFRQANTRQPASYAELIQIVQDGFAQAWWCESSVCEAKVKEETKATTRCMPLEQPGGEGRCVVCGERATRQVIFARAY